MPLYEYRCEACGRTVEVLQKVDDAPPESCAHCGGKLHKLLSAPAFRFKGSGWYVTDYARKGGGASSSESPTPSSAGSSDPAGATSEKKPAAESTPASAAPKGPDKD